MRVCASSQFETSLGLKLNTDSVSISGHVCVVKVEFVQFRDRCGFISTIINDFPFIFLYLITQF